MGEHMLFYARHIRNMQNTPVEPATLGRTELHLGHFSGDFYPASRKTKLEHRPT
jgi:hypothetical protein